MKLNEIIEKLGLVVATKSVKPDNEVTGGYASDLLSDVMANTKKDNIWVTLQIHQNIIGVAGLKELAGIIIINGRTPEADTLKKADEEGITIMLSELPAFEVIGRLYALGLKGA